MKNKRLTSFLLAAIMIFSFLLSGCAFGNAAKKSADAFCSLVIKGGAEDLEKYGIKESEKSQLLDKYRDGIKKQLKNNISMWGGSASETQLDDITDAYLETLSKITYETKQISKSKDTAEVEISTTHFDTRKVDAQAVIMTLDELENMDFSSENEESKKMLEIYLNKLPEVIRNAEISTEKTTNTYKFAKKDNYWVPEDKENFGYMVIMQATNDNNLNLSIDETRVTPEESVEIFWNMTAKADASGIEKLGYSKELGDKLVKYINKTVVKELKNEFNDSSVSLTDEEVEKFVQAMIKGLSKNEAQFEVVSKNDNKAKVKITSTYIDMTAVSNSALEKTKNDAIASGTYDEQKIMELYISNITDELNNVQPVSNSSNQITCEFTKVADMWVPSNVNQFTESVERIYMK